MKYDFTSILDRTGKDAIAVEHIPIPGAQVKEGFDRIPMWVADMNFPTVPTIVEAMMERVRHSPTDISIRLKNIIGRSSGGRKHATE